MELPHLNQDRIFTIAWYHGIKIQKTTNITGCRWSASEDDIIRQESRNGVPDSLSLVKLLPGRTSDAIEWRANYLQKLGPTIVSAAARQSRWTAEEDNKCISEYNRGTPLVKIAEMLSRTYCSIQVRIRLLKAKQVVRPVGLKFESKS